MDVCKKEQNAKILEPLVAQLVERATVEPLISRGRWFDSGREDF